MSAEPYERAILAAVLLDNAVLPQAAPLNPSDFSLRGNGIIYRRMKDLFERGAPVDMVTLIDELQRHGELESVGDAGYLSDLLNGAIDRTDIRWHVGQVREAAGTRHIAHGVEAIGELARKGLDIAELRARLADLERSTAQFESSNGSQPIRGFDSVPDLLTLQIDPMDYVVQGLLPRKSLTLWTGIDGTAKTYLAQNLAIAVSTGGKFLGAQCRKMPVLYLDYENPDFVVRSRLELMGAAPGPNLRVWGTWLAEQPPQVGSQLLPAIAKAVQPLMIFDPFRYAHGAEENDSTQMMVVMKDLRACVVAGATVVAFHHPAKAEGSTGRGSTAIRGAVDLAYMQELSDETGLITLRCVKNRFGERPVLTIRPDFEEGTFELTDSPKFTKKMEDVDALAEIIRANPGATQNRILEKWGGNKNHGISLLKEYNGSRWDMVKDGQSFRYSRPVQEGCTGLSTGVPVDSIPGVPGDRYTGTHPLGCTGTYRSTPGGVHAGTESEPIPEQIAETPPKRCYVHPKNKSEWWAGEDGSQVCGICHPRGRVQ